MTEIRKFELAEGLNVVKLHSANTILDLGITQTAMGESKVYIWFEVDTESKKGQRSFYLHKDGDEINPKTEKFVGLVQDFKLATEPFVRHIYEVIK